MPQFNYKDIVEGQLPLYLYKSRDLESQAMGNSLNKLQSDVDRLEEDVNPLTAINKGLEAWEGFFKLPSNIEESIEIRRARVVSELIQFMSDENVIRKDEMESIISLFGEVKVIEHFSGYIFDVVFTNVKSLNLKEIENIIQKIKPSWLDHRFTSQYIKELQLETSYKEYPISYPMCGTFLCGTKPYYANQGISINTGLNVNTNKIETSQKYKMTGTFKSGEVKL